MQALDGIGRAIGPPENWQRLYSIYVAMEDCYFFVDPDPNVPEEERRMKVICTKCRQEHMPDVGWFYPGSKEGYGPFDYQCCKCQKFIYKAEYETETSD